MKVKWLKRYTMKIVFETENDDLGNKIVDHVQTEYAMAWNRNKAHGRVNAVDERVDIEEVEYRGG